MFKRLCAFFLLVCLALPFSIPAIAGNPVWIDVRTDQEYSEGHVEQAVNIPYEEIGERIESVTKNKDQTIYVYCRSGRRSGIAKDTLNDLGYTDVVNLGGLDDALAKAGQDSGH